MHLLDLFESTNEGYTVTRGIDRERYQERAGLEGPFQTKSGKVVYYDAKEGQYYDPDTDMYIDDDDYRALDEADNSVEQSKIEQIVINNDIVPGIKKLMDVLAYDEATARREAEAITKHVARHRWNKMTPQERAEAIEKNKSEKSQMATDFKKVASKFGEEIDLDEGVGTYLKGAVLAGLLGLGVNQMADMASAKNSPLGQAMAQAAEQGDEYAAKHLKKLDLYMDANDTGSIKILSKKYLGRTVESVMEEVATNQKTQRILSLMRAKHPTAQNDMEAMLLAYEKGQSQDRQDINTLYSQNREEEREIEQLEKDLEKLKARRNVSEDYYETDEQRELARLGRILMDMGKKRDDDVGAAMGAVGNELTKYGTPQGASNMRKLEQLTGQKESVIMKMMALAQKVKGDVAVGDETAGNDDDEEVKEVLRKVPYVGYKGPGSDFRAYDEPDVSPRRTARRDENNYAVLINGKTWKVFARRATAEKAAATIEKKYNKNTEVQATRDPVSEGAAKDFDEKFRKHLDLYTKSQGVRDYRAKKAQMNLDQMKATDPGNINPLIIDRPKAHKKAREKGVPQSVITTNQNRKLPEQAESPMVTATIPNNLRDSASRLERLAKENGVEYARQGRTVTLTGPRMNVRNIFFKMAYAPGNHPEMVPVTEGLDHDIKIGDTVETKKMGQMQGVVTGFSTKTGDTRVMFKHKSGKVYATVPDNLKVIDTAKKTESLEVDSEGAIGTVTMRKDFDWEKVSSLADRFDVAFDSPDVPPGKKGTYYVQADYEDDIQEFAEHLWSLDSTLFNIDELSAWDTVTEAKKKPVPTNPELWSRAKAAAKQKYDVYPSAYANAFASKWYKEKGGGWRMGNPKK